MCVYDLIPAAGDQLIVALLGAEDEEGDHALFEAEGEVFCNQAAEAFPEVGFVEKGFENVYGKTSMRVGVRASMVSPVRACH